MSKLLRSLQSFLLSFTLIMGITNGSAQAQKPFEKSWHDSGYTSIEKALTTCERLFQRDIVLPTRVPPMVFTHQFGRCDNNGVNSEFIVEYVHEKKSGVHYRITVRPAKFGMKLIQERIQHVYTLQNQAKAVLYRIRDDVPFYILILEKNGWQYMLMLDDGGLNQASSDILLGIASTIQ